MQASHDMSELLGAVGVFLVDLLVVSAGRVVVRVLSFNRWRGEAFGADEARIYAAAGAFSFVRHGQRVVTRMGLGFAGALVWLLVGLGTAWLLA